MPAIGCSAPSSRGKTGAALCAAAVLLGCSSPPPVSSSSANPAPGASARPLAEGPPLLADVELPPPIASEVGRDGEDDGDTELPRLAALMAARADGARFEAVEDPPASAHPVVCDLVGFDGALFASHATEIIDRTGSRIHRYDPSAPAGRRWQLAFDYDRDGAGGQGLSRLRVIGGRLYAVDSDSTSAGFFDLSDGFVEAYLFVSDEKGRFAPVRGYQAPPATRALAGCFHAFDVISFGGALLATGGTAMRGEGGRPRYPGGLWWGEPDGAGALLPRWALGLGVGVVRPPYLHRLGGRLYVGFQNNERRARFDLAVLGGDLAASDNEPVLGRVTPEGGWLTRRFASGEGTLYWLASGYRRASDRRPATLFRSTDGRAFQVVALPAGAGEPQDLVVVRGGVVVLASGGLYAAPRGGAVRRLAPAPPGDHFGHFETFCSAPLAVVDQELYAGSTRDGRIYRIRLGEPGAGPQ